MKATDIFSSRFFGIGVVIMCLLAGFVLYSNVLHGPFVFDDDPNIVENPHIRVTDLSIDELRDAGFKSRMLKRPVANISFALNYYIHGYDVVGYHVVNILIHILTAIFLYFFVKATLEIWEKRSPGDSGCAAYSAPVLAFCAVLIWLVHPVQSQSVSYIVQRMASLAGMFYVLSLLLYVKGRLVLGSRKWLLFVGSAVSGVLALGSKEIAATLPFFVFLYEWYFFQDLDRAWLKRNMLIVSVVVGIFLVVALLYLGVHPYERILADYDRRDFTMWQRVLTEFRVVVLYISLLFFPHPFRLNLDYDFPVSYSLINPVTTLFSIVVLAGLGGLAIRLARRERLISFCIIWFFGNLVIESSVWPLELVYEHRLYVPSMFAVVLVVVLAAQYVKWRWAAVGLLCVVVGIFSLWTFQRNGVWADELALWQDTVKKSPNKARPHNNVGMVLNDYGKIDEAMSHFERALQIDPDYVEAHNNLGMTLFDSGKVEESIEEYALAIQLDPEFSMAYYNMGVAMEKQGKVAEAIKHYSRAIEIDPYFADAYNNLGAFLIRSGKLNVAIDYLSKAMELDPYRAETHYNMGLANENSGNTSDAIKMYLEALRINPDIFDAYQRLGWIFEGMGRFDEAVKYYSKALQLNPEYIKIHVNLGGILLRRGMVDDAVRHYEEALRMEPGLVEAHNGLGVALVMKGDIGSAIGHFREALRLNPSDVGARANLERAKAMRGGLYE